MEEKHALVSGGTGLIGKQLCQILDNDPEFKTVTSLVRKSKGSKYSKIAEVSTDFDALSSTELSNEVTDAFCCLGTTMKKAGSKSAFYKVDYEYVLAFAKLALVQGAKNFYLVSSMGADPNSLFYYNKVKGKIEAALNKLSFKSLHIYRPSMLLGDREEARIGESIGKFVFGTLDPILPSNYKGIAGQQVAKAMVKQAKQEKEGHHIYLSGEIAEM